jgi:two-component system KDP operon response regulator KdpE
MSHGPRVLVIDNDPAVRRYLHRSLTAEGYRVREVPPGQTALGCICDQPPDLVILDIDLPEGGGADVIRTVREISPVPILALSAHEDEDSLVEALKSGADDYVRKPFGIRELLARALSALRRAARERGAPSIFVSGDLAVDLVRRRVWSRGEEVRLSAKPYEVLRVLVENAGKALPHREILAAVWGAGRADKVQYLRLAIRELRRKLESDPAKPMHIVTETCIGYRLRVTDPPDRRPIGRSRILARRCA